MQSLWQVLTVKIRAQRNEDRATVDERTVVRVAEESLRMLALTLPNDFPLPDKIPETHTQLEVSGRRGHQAASSAARKDAGRGRGSAGGRGQGRGVGRGPGPPPREQRPARGSKQKHMRRVECSASEEEEDSPPEEEEERSESKSESESDKGSKGPRNRSASSSSPSHSSSDVDDDAAPIPDGYNKLHSWQPADLIDAFMFWTRLGGKGEPKWHCFKVLKVLNGQKYTYDAHVMGFPKERRGVKVTVDLFNEGVFVPLTPVSASSATVKSLRTTHRGVQESHAVGDPQQEPPIALPASQQPHTSRNEEVQDIAEGGEEGNESDFLLDLIKVSWHHALDVRLCLSFEMLLVLSVNIVRGVFVFALCDAGH